MACHQQRGHRRRQHDGLCRPAHAGGVGVPVPNAHQPFVMSLGIIVGIVLLVLYCFVLIFLEFFPSLAGNLDVRGKAHLEELAALEYFVWFRGFTVPFQSRAYFLKVEAVRRAEPVISAQADVIALVIDGLKVGGRSEVINVERAFR